MSDSGDATSESNDDTNNVAITCFCTLAVTGPNVRFQSIYICRDCNGDDTEEMQCICGACAEQCHEDHDVEFIGMGPSYCDCGASCRIATESQKKAVEMGCHDCEKTMEDYHTEIFQPHTFQCSELASPEACQRLIRQAQALVEHSRESFWLDASTTSGDGLCELEQLAWQTFQKHSSTYKLNNLMGAEWWVQIKDTSASTTAAAAVDVHYDKDENLAEAFDLGAFPVLSTVTYLTEDAYPTLVFPHCHDDPDDDEINSMLVSHPRRGKHLVFDGRLLHGAPANPALLLSPSQPPTGLRVTFLVNLWQHEKPCGIKVLKESIRDAVKSSVADGAEQLPQVLFSDSSMHETKIDPLVLKTEEGLPEEMQCRLEIPFVSKGATWVDDTDNDDDGIAQNLVLLTFPPPPHESITVSVQFEDGMQAYLEYQDIDDDAGEEEESKVQASGPYEESYV